MANIPKNLTFIGLLFFILALTVVMCGKVPINKRSLVFTDGDGLRDTKDQQKLRPSKKTFCNAFTGCNGKRSEGPVKDYDDERESVKEALDENAKIDDVARDILAEARLWEAFQARNSMMMYPMMRRQGFFGREKRAAHSAYDESVERAGGLSGLKKLD